MSFILKIATNRDFVELVVLYHYTQNSRPSFYPWEDVAVLKTARLYTDNQETKVYTETGFLTAGRHHHRHTQSAT